MAAQFADATRQDSGWDFEFQKHLQNQPSNFINLLDKDSELRKLYETAIKRIKQVDSLIASI